jgi:hypothetical protein
MAHVVPAAPVVIAGSRLCILGLHINLRVAPVVALLALAAAVRVVRVALLPLWVVCGGWAVGPLLVALVLFVLLVFLVLFVLLGTKLPCTCNKQAAAQHCCEADWANRA